MSQNLQQIIAYTCLLAVIYMIWGSSGVIEALITLGVLGILGLILKLITDWWYGPDPFPRRGADARAKGRDQRSGE